MNYLPCHYGPESGEYNTTDSIRHACGRCGGDTRRVIGENADAVNRQRAQLVERARRRYEASREAWRADKNGVIS